METGDCSDEGQKIFDFQRVYVFVASEDFKRRPLVVKGPRVRPNGPCATMLQRGGRDRENLKHFRQCTNLARLPVLLVPLRKGVQRLQQLVRRHAHGRERLVDDVLRVGHPQRVLLDGLASLGQLLVYDRGGRDRNLEGRQPVEKELDGPPVREYPKENETAHDVRSGNGGHRMLADGRDDGICNRTHVIHLSQ